MNKIELARHAAMLMRDQGYKKEITIPRHVFHISDDEGNTKNFVVRGENKQVTLTGDDVEAVIDACVHVIEDALKAGDQVSVRGFGSLGLIYRKGRALKNVADGSDVYAQPRYAPKFYFGKDLKICAKIYEQSLADCKIADAPPETAPGGEA